MRITGLLLLVGFAACLSAILLVTGWRQPRPSLDRTVRHLRRPPLQPSTESTPVTRRLGRALLGSSTIGIGVDCVTRTSTLTTVFGRQTAVWHPSLRLIGRDPAQHLGMLVIGSIVGFVVPTLVLAVLQLAGIVTLGTWVPAGLSVIAAVVVPVALHGDAMARSAERRIDVRYQLSAYLDMVTMLLAGNTGHEGALGQAAQAGDGLLFRELRRRMREVATVGDSLVGALSLVGEDFGVIELEQVAGAAALSAAEGAPVARTLSAKCGTLRSTLAAEQEASARLRTDKVTPPLVGMALLFMALIIYPALALT